MTDNTAFDDLVEALEEEGKDFEVRVDDEGTRHIVLPESDEDAPMFSASTTGEFSLDDEQVGGDE